MSYLMLPSEKIGSVAGPFDQQQELPKSWNETALDWLERSQKVDADAAVPKDPTSAAWAFVRAREPYGSGISFLDVVMKKKAEHLPIVELRGGTGVGKTWTLITVVARFIVSTRATRFQSSSDDLPQVVFMDSLQNIKMQHIMSAVRTELLRDVGDAMVNDEESFQLELQSALRRIILIFGEGVNTWVPTLESLRHALVGKPFPTLVLWDGFLSDVHDERGKMEVIRQVNRLTKDTSVQLITTEASNRYYAAWEKHVGHRIRLERLEAIDTADQHEFIATTSSQPAEQLAYTITRGGILT
jgi:hypothetical protein